MHVVRVEMETSMTLSADEYTYSMLCILRKGFIHCAACSQQIVCQIVVKQAAAV